ncbi:MAG: 4-hydroxy-tetrahydrodipicolinate synthase [archaeon]
MNYRHRTPKNKPVEARNIDGVYTALITPMLAGKGLSNSIDYPKLYRLIDDQERAKVAGIVIAGTTGQSATLDWKEHEELVTNAFNYTGKNYPLMQFIVGAGSNCTREALIHSWNIERKIGPSTFLHVTGYYNNPTQEGLFQHYRTLSESLPNSNIIIYNVPGRTSSNILPETVIRLANETSNIVGIKEASGNLEAAKEIIDHTRRNRFRVLSGEDHLVNDMMQLGAAGVISASANLAPRYFNEIISYAQRGHCAEAEAMQKEINPLVKQGVFRIKNPIPLAYYFNTHLRLPLTPVPEELRPGLDTLISGYTPERLGIDLRNYR